MNTATEALTTARAVHAAAVDRRTALQARLSKAHAAMTEAAEARRRMVAELVTEPASKTAAVMRDSAAAKIDATMRDAAASVALLQDALEAHEATVTTASAAAAAASTAAEYEAFRDRIQARIDAARQVDAAAAALDAANQAYHAAGDELQLYWPAKMAMPLYLVETLRDKRAVAWRLPAAIQTVIVQCGSVNVLPSLAAREHAIWMNHLPIARRSAA